MFLGDGECSFNYLEKSGLPQLCWTWRNLPQPFTAEGLCLQAWHHKLDTHSTVDTNVSPHICFSHVAFNFQIWIWFFPCYFSVWKYKADILITPGNLKWFPLHIILWRWMDFYLKIKCLLIGCWMYVVHISEKMHSQVYYNVEFIHQCLNHASQKLQFLWYLST